MCKGEICGYHWTHFHSDVVRSEVSGPSCQFFIHLTLERCLAHFLTGYHSMVGINGFLRVLVSYDISIWTVSLKPTAASERKKLAGPTGGPLQCINPSPECYISELVQLQMNHCLLNPPAMYRGENKISYYIELEDLPKATRRPQCGPRLKRNPVGSGSMTLSHMCFPVCFTDLSPKWMNKGLLQHWHVK